MPQFVSKDHQEMMRRLRKIFTYADVIGWPDAEVNLGHLCGLAEANLRADAFIRMATRQGVVVEWQSEIHTEEGAKGQWFNHDEIQGRDNLKRQLCAKAGVSLVELWTLDITDEQLIDMIHDAADRSFMTTIAKDALDDLDKPLFATQENSFVPSDKGFAPPREGFKSEPFTPSGSQTIGTGEKTSWSKQKFSSRTSFK